MSYRGIRGRGHIVVSGDPVGVGIGVSIFLVCKVSCQPVIGFLPNVQCWIYNWDITKTD